MNQKKTANKRPEKNAVSPPELCLPEEVPVLSRRQLLSHGISLTAYANLASLLSPDKARSQSGSQSYPLKRKLVWINMSGGWDILEVMDPKTGSTPGIDMIYDYELSHQLTGGEDNARLGRWLPGMAGIGEDLLIIRGLAMGTTSHMAGSVYMDTGILSNAGRVNSASIPAIVASESSSTIPLIQLNGGSEPMTDRGLLKPVSAVRAENLELYRSMYPEDTQDAARQSKILDYITESTTRYRQSLDPDKPGSENDRLESLETSVAKVRTQFDNNVGEKLVLSSSDLSNFSQGAPTGMGRGMIQTFALAQKLITEGICDCINLGIGGFDTHSNQSTRLQTTLTGVDFVIRRFVDGLRTAGILDSTLIVLYSDFGRTPKINGSNGRDHWPVGGALMIGGGIRGGRAVGGTDDSMRAYSIDPDSGRTSENGQQLSPIHLGGAVLELTLGAEYLQYRNYLSSLPALTHLKNS
ncbi:MAG: DUF1501 domain-containing protein [Deltaproteobacteria bacterium]|nr:DUF1501 domain-containing protein [Deltaproteobacteria bacterium]